MADPMKIRAKLQGSVCNIAVLMSHPMETGLRKDGAGNVIPAHFITSLTVALNGRVMAELQCGPSVSRNPVCNFKLPGAAAGDKVTVKWVDNKGDNRTDEATVA